MIVLVTGATGLVGKEVVSLLLQHNYTVHFLTTSKSKIKQTENFKGFYWNPKKNEIDLNCFNGVEAIIHLAGSTIAKRWTKSYKEEIITSRVDSANLLFQSLKKNPNQVKQIISASAIGIYPDSLTNYYTEDFTDFNDTYLSKVVQHWESSINQFEQIGLLTSKIRIGLVLAKNGGALPQLIKPLQYGLGSIFGSGKQIQSWIHIQDLARLFQFVLENKLQGNYNAVAPNPVSHRDLMFALAQKLNKPLYFPNIPKFVMKLVLGEMHTLLFESQMVSSKNIENKGFVFKYEDIENALSDLLLK